ncbi:hypothetical protein ACQKQD_06980 [Methylobacterium sp. NPDC080182]|uniref:hypothetical protein n=1 Tax=Methylobacterium sp. NPDC080182 TaxID=3390590 RepID=UPI003D07721F
MLSMEFVILARLVCAVQNDDDKVDAKGLSCLENAIEILEQCGLISETYGFGRGTGGTWTSKEWQHNDGAETKNPSQAVLDACSMIVEQYCSMSDERIHIGKWQQGDAWFNAAEYLAKVGVIKNFVKYKIELSENEHKYLTSIGAIHKVCRTIDAIDAEFVDRLGAWRRSYPDTEFE